MLDIKSTGIAAVQRISAVPVILEIVTKITGMRFAAVARVTDATWIACAVLDKIEFGLKRGDELELGTTICDEIRQHHRPVVFGHASSDPHWSKHHTPRIYKLESYISIPIFRANREFFGTLCAIDPSPADFSDGTAIDTMKLFAELIGTQLDSELAMEQTRKDLGDAQSLGELREKFIAVLGHDLRNPVHAISIGANVLKGNVSEDKRRTMVDMISRSARRIEGLIENTLDFAHSRMGEGIPVYRVEDPQILAELQHVIDEIQSVYPNREIVSRMEIRRLPFVDTKRLGQLLGNLVANAVTHGSAAHPVEVEVSSDEHRFELRVTNRGAPIPPQILPGLFEPFTRLETATPEQGLGLGLYIASQIALAHNGTLDVSSTAEKTSFTLRIPTQS